MKVLIVEDNQRVAQFILKGLKEAGCVADHANNGPDGLYLATTGTYDVIILDRMLPGGLEGLTIVAALRKIKSKTPVLILSALAEVDDRIQGLRAGGDDYLTKPFAFGELYARLQALMRRTRDAFVGTDLTIGDLRMNLITHEVTRSNIKLDLMPREFKILEYLMRHAGQVVTRAMILENVWEYHCEPKTNVIDTHMSNLRQKIDAKFNRPLLHTVRGFGYRLSNDV